MDNRILIVDDDPGMRGLLVAYLTATGHDVLTAANGHDAMRIMRAHGPALVITDWDMPGMDGLELCRAIRAERKPDFVYILILTAKVEPGRLVEALASGADDFIAKPFGRDDLMAKLDAARRIVRTYEELARRCPVEHDPKRRCKTAVAAEQALAVTAHELRNPLAAMRAIVEHLLGDECEPSQQTTLLNSLHQDVFRMTDTVNDLLDAARLSAAQAKWSWALFSLKQACAVALDQAKPLVGPGVSLRGEIDPGAAQVHGDPHAIMRLIVNLLGNALRHTHHGSVRLIARLAEDAGARWAEIEVRDTGEGMSQELISRLGNPSLSNPGFLGLQQGGAAGLGLAICRAIAAAHHGTLAIESVEGNGTTITVRFRADLPGPAVEPGEPGNAMVAAA